MNVKKSEAAMYVCRHETRRLAGAIAAILKRSRDLAAVIPASGIVLGGIVAGPQAMAGQGSAQKRPQETLSQIVVTAQRRRQTLQQIPYNISAVSASAIQESGATSINDLTRVVSGLVTVDEGPGARGLTNNLTLRGIRTDSPGGGQLAAEQPGQTVNSVSTYFGETPVFFPIPLYDVDRVEVLRGPQGTLYGSGAQAGTIRFIPNRPSFDRFYGRVDVTGSLIDGASSLNNANRDVTGFVNIPIASHLAARIVAGVEHDGGFINNVDLVERTGNGITAVPIPSVPGDLTSGPVIGPEQRNTNTASQWYTRAAVRWQPTSKFELRLNYLHQNIASANAQLSNPGYPGGPLDFTTPLAVPPSSTNQPYWPHSTFIMNPGGTYTSTQFVLTPEKNETNLVSAVATMDFGLATLTSASSYYNIRSVGITDWTPQIDNPAVINYTIYPPYNFYPRIITVAEVPANDHSFIQELRLVSNGTHFFDYVIGLYYQREAAESGWHQYMPGIAAYNAAIGTPNPSQYGDLIWNYDRTSLFQDRAAFGQLTAHITKAWQVSAGTRFFDQTFGINTGSYFYFCGAACASDQVNIDGATVTNKATSFTNHIWMLNTAYDLSKHLKAYATFSEGFRRGGANGVPTGGPYASLPIYQTYTPDLAKNYEIGLKGSFARVRFTADVYRIDLSNFQFNAVDNSGIPATYNGDSARSQGLEVDLQAQLTHSTTAQFGYSYTDAKVTRTTTLYDYPSYALPAFGGTGQTVPLFGGPILSGSPLPGVPKTTLTIGVDHIVSLSSFIHRNWDLRLHIDGAYHSKEVGDIQPTSPYNWTIPSSFVGNARATVDPGGNLTYALFVTNFTNDPGYSGGNNDQQIPNYSRARVVMAPRTYGFSIGLRF